ncbi:DUF2961 domain-containing protein [Candidatus Pacearchaeota archaeon]|jgi:hypothetical protein|nr:DUF2961 domain-containing protein [Candidatus Pacearchaeota archaeon]
MSIRIYKSPIPGIPQPFEELRPFNDAKTNRFKSLTSTNEHTILTIPAGTHGVSRKLGMVSNNETFADAICRVYRNSTGTGDPDIELRVSELMLQPRTIGQNFALDKSYTIGANKYYNADDGGGLSGNVGKVQFVSAYPFAFDDGLMVTIQPTSHVGDRNVYAALHFNEGPHPKPLGRYKHLRSAYYGETNGDLTQITKAGSLIASETAGANAANSTEFVLDAGSDTTDFPSFGTFYIDGIDSVRYTGKTANSLTGCSEHPETLGTETITLSKVELFNISGKGPGAIEAWSVYLQKDSINNLSFFENQYEYHIDGQVRMRSTGGEDTIWSGYYGCKFEHIADEEGMMTLGGATSQSVMYRRHVSDRLLFNSSFVMVHDPGDPAGPDSFLEKGMLLYYSRD